MIIPGSFLLIGNTLGQIFQNLWPHHKIYQLPEEKFLRRYLKYPTLILPLNYFKCIQGLMYNVVANPHDN